MRRFFFGSLIHEIVFVFFFNDVFGFVGTFTVFLVDFTVQAATFLGFEVRPFLFIFQL